MFWNNGFIPSRIGLIAGEGEFPLLCARAASSMGKEVVLFAVEGHTDKRVEEFASEVHSVSLGALERLLGLLHSSGVKKVILAGSLPKREIYNPAFQPDRTMAAFIQKIQNKGDDHLLRAFEFFLKVRGGVSILDARRLLKNDLAGRGVLTRRSPAEGEWKDLRLGFKVAKAVGKMDVGQTVIVKNGVVLAVEALEGTDNAIRRGGDLARQGAVVVKIAKPNQNLRFDLPCVGPETLNCLKGVSSRVLGIESGKTVMLSKGLMIQTADRESMSLVGL